MPELPEVETVLQGLRPHLEGARLVRVTQNRPDLRFPLPKNFATRLTGARVEAMNRRAKYLLADLDTGETLVAHLGMTGRFTVGDQQPGRFHNQAGGVEKHTHLVFETDKGRVIAFNDARRFGYMDLLPTAEVSAHPWFRALGPEPLGADFNAKGLAATLEGKKQNIKVTLLDQRIVAGLGNIYVCEALYRAGIDPRRAAGALKPPEIAKLVEAAKDVLTAAPGARAAAGRARDPPPSPDARRRPAAPARLRARAVARAPRSSRLRAQDRRGMSAVATRSAPACGKSSCSPAGSNFFRRPIPRSRFPAARESARCAG